jgi:hypothetical protein
MKKSFCVVVIGLLFTLSGGLAYSQEREPEKVPRAPRAGRLCPCQVVRWEE